MIKCGQHIHLWPPLLCLINPSHTTFSLNSLMVMNDRESWWWIRRDTEYMQGCIFFLSSYSLCIPYIWRCSSLHKVDKTGNNDHLKLIEMCYLWEGFILLIFKRHVEGNCWGKWLSRQRKIKGEKNSSILDRAYAHSFALTQRVDRQKEILKVLIHSKMQYLYSWCLYTCRYRCKYCVARGENEVVFMETE